MQKAHVASLVAVGALAFGAGAFAQDVVGWIGAAPSHHSFERYEMAIGVTAGQQPRKASRVDEDRKVVLVPNHYGALVGMTGDSQATVFWYRDAEGALRNAVLTDPAGESYKIVCGPSSRFEADAREK